jgi:hypothetical protein
MGQVYDYWGSGLVDDVEFLAEVEAVHPADESERYGRILGSPVYVFKTTRR